MTLTVNLRKMLHRKSAEYCAPLLPGNTVAGGFVVSDKSDLIPSHDIAYYVGGVSAIYNYNADQDAWLQLPNSGLAGTFGAGACGEFRAISAPGGNITNTATGGTTTTIITNLTITRNLEGCEIRVIAGIGVGYLGTIKSNTLGANAIITVNDASGVAFTSTTQYQIFGGSMWVLNSGAGAIGFSVYDRATNAWTARSVATLPTTWGSDAQLVSTPGRSSQQGQGFVNGTATSGTSTTLVNTGKTWPTNGHVNSQVRIISGTGAGQIRVITANTADTLTVAAWTVTVDSTSVYRIEGNDDVFYLFGNNVANIYKFTISTNTWTGITPGVARGAVMATGGTADWIDGVTNTSWTDGTYGAHYTTTLIKQNGRYIYSMRGGASNVLDVYDIAANTWIPGVVYGQQTETFGAGSCSVDLDGNIFIQKDGTGRILKFDVAKHVLEPFVLNPIPQGTALVGDKMFITTLNESPSRLNFLYTLQHTRNELTRWVII